MCYGIIFHINISEEFTLEASYCSSEFNIFVNPKIERTTDGHGPRDINIPFDVFITKLNPEIVTCIKAFICELQYAAKNKTIDEIYCQEIENTN